MTSLLNNLRLWWLGLRKTANLIVDSFRPSGMVELRLIHAQGPNKGKVYKKIKGRNVVTSWIGSSHTSGRDLMRRLLAPPASESAITASGGTSLSGVASCYVKYMMLGASSTAEDATDIALKSPLDGTGDTEATEIVISSYSLDGSNPYITFVAEWSESQANTALSEVGLYSGRDPRDFIARKTFSTFTKTNEFSLEIRWTLRF